jgi:hypothetical protein
VVEGEVSLDSLTLSPIQFQVFEDQRERMQYGEPDWVLRPRFGEVKEFISATWKGEPLQLAIIEPWDTEAWVTDGRQGRGPQLLLRPRALWQVVEVNAILGVAGRIPRDDTNKFIAFDKSFGALGPPLYD